MLNASKGTYPGWPAGGALKGRGEAPGSGGLARLGVDALAAWKENQALGPVVQGPLLKTF